MKTKNELKEKFKNRFKTWIMPQNLSKVDELIAESISAGVYLYWTGDDEKDVVLVIDQLLVKKKYLENLKNIDEIGEEKLSYYLKNWPTMRVCGSSNQVDHLLHKILAKAVNYYYTLRIFWPHLDKWPGE